MCPFDSHRATEEIAKHQPLAALLEIWRRMKGPDVRTPARTAVDPVALGRAGLLPDVWVIEKIRAAEFQFRLVGENIRLNFEKNLIGRPIGEIFDARSTDLWTEHYTAIIDGDHIHYSEGEVSTRGIPVYYGHRVLLPLSDEEGRNRFCIGVFEKKPLASLKAHPEQPHYAVEKSIFAPAASVPGLH